MRCRHEAAVVLALREGLARLADLGNNSGYALSFKGVGLTLRLNLCLLWLWLEGVNPRNHKQSKQRINPNAKPASLKTKTKPLLSPMRGRVRQLVRGAAEGAQDLDARLLQDLWGQL